MCLGKRRALVTARTMGGQALGRSVGWRMTQRDSLFFVRDYSNASAAGCMKEVAETVAFDE